MPAHPSAHGPTDDAMGIEVHHHRQVQPTLTCRDACDVGRPTLIWRLGLEILLQQTLHDGMRRVTLRCDPNAPLGTSSKPLQAHQAGDLVEPHANAVGNQLCIHSMATIDPSLTSWMQPILGTSSQSRCARALFGRPRQA